MAKARGVRIPRRSGALFLVVASLASVSVGCAATGGNARASGGGLNLLTGDQIRETSARDLYAAIRQLRPNWLTARSRGSLLFEGSNRPIVYVDGVRYGEIRTLNSMEVNEVARVQFIGAADATTRWGTGHGGGVISVDLARGGR